MDKTPASLIDQTQSVLQPGDSSVAGLNQFVERPGQPYYSGAHILTAQRGPFGTMGWMAGLAMQTCTNMFISAPPPGQASKITHMAKQSYSAGQFGVGQAPTSGIFTGVEDKC